MLDRTFQRAQLMALLAASMICLASVPSRGRDGSGIGARAFAPAAKMAVAFSSGPGNCLTASAKGSLGVGLFCCRCKVLSSLIRELKTAWSSAAHCACCWWLGISKTFILAPAWFRLEGEPLVEYFDDIGERGGLDSWSCMWSRF